LLLREFAATFVRDADMRPFAEQFMPSTVRVSSTVSIGFDDLLRGIATTE